MIKYTVTFRKRAAKEFLEAIAWYKERSVLAAENFVNEVNEALARVESDPTNYKNIYKHFYELKLHHYPFSFVYFIDKEENRIILTTIFHSKEIRKRSLGSEDVQLVVRRNMFLSCSTDKLLKE